MFSNFKENRSPSCVLVTWEDKYLNSACRLLLILSLSFHCSWCCVVRTDLSVRWGSCPCCSSAPPDSLLMGWSKKNKNLPSYHVSIVQQQLKQWCVNIVLVLDQKPNTIWATMQNKEKPSQSQTLLGPYNMCNVQYTLIRYFFISHPLIYTLT